MLTIFSMFKPFRGRFDLIQRNAIRSWLALEGCQVIACGDEEGVAEICQEFHLPQIKSIARNEHGTPLLSDLFVQVERHASHDRLLFANGDIILTNSVLDAARTTAHLSCLLVGRRWESAADATLDIHERNWKETLERTVRADGHLLGPHWVDYFLFQRGAWAGLAPILLGRYKCDLHLLWHAKRRGITLIDCSKFIFAVHQSHHRQAFDEHGRPRPSNRAHPESVANFEIVGRRNQFCTIFDADLILEPPGTLHPPAMARRLAALALRAAILPHAKLNQWYVSLRRRHVSASATT